MGIYNNYGIGLLPEHNDNRFNIFASTRYHDMTKRPFIAVRYEEIPDFKMPLPGGVGWKLTVECGGKTFDRNPVTDSSHTGRGYYSLDFSPYWLNGSVETLATDVPIYAPAAGKVVYAGYSDANGYYVKIDHDCDVGGVNTGFQTVLIHMKYPGPIVSTGQIIQQGQRLGTMGGTGVPDGGGSYPVHLHMTVYFKDRAGSADDGNSVELGWVAMEGRLLTDYKVGSTWSDTYGKWTPVYYYQSSNTH